MDKNYNLVIDIKRNFFNSVRGLKQGDNNSVLNIVLIQNCIPYDLTGCTVRMNYKLRNGQTLLQMADIIDAKKGKIRINILTKALVYAGEMKADISVFDCNNKKITSATISLFVDTSIYTNDYSDNQDLDIIQNLYTTEEKRIKAENVRIANEVARISKEDTRKENETTRCSNEKNRVSSEATRISNEKDRIENSKVQKKEIENITALNGTMANEHTARTTEYNGLKKIILDENSSATLENEINDINNQINEDNMLNIKSDNRAISLENSVNGFANFSLEGNTIANLVLEDAVGTKTSTGEICLSYIIDRTNNKKFKLNTTYTLILNCNIKKNGGKIVLQIKKIKKDGSYVFNRFDTTTVTGNFNYIGTFSLDSNSYDHIEFLGLYSMLGNNEVDITKFMVLEGDWTQKTIPDQFTGIKSVGETEGNKIKILSRGKNFFDKNTMYRNKGVLPSNGSISTVHGYYASDLIKIKENTEYTIQNKGGGSVSTGIAFYANDKNFISGLPYTLNLTNNTIHFTSPINTRYIRFTIKNDGNPELTQLEEGATSTQYESYKSDTLDIQLKEPLRSLNNIKDIIDKDGTITRRIGKIIFNGCTDKYWKHRIDYENAHNIKNSLVFQTEFNFKVGDMISNDFIVSNSSRDFEHIKAEKYYESKLFKIFIDKTKLDTPDTDGFKKYLKQNPVTVLYQLVEPIVEKLDKPLNIEIFKNGSITINSAIPPVVNIDYPGNLKGQVESNVNKIGEIDNNFYSVFENILMLADKELRMSSVELLETDNVTDLKNKINEIINIWKEDDRNDDMG